MKSSANQPALITRLDIQADVSCLVILRVNLEFAQPTSNSIQILSDDEGVELEQHPMAPTTLDVVEKWRMKRYIHHRKLFQELKELVISGGDGVIEAQTKLIEMNVTCLHQAVICNNYNEVQTLLKSAGMVAGINEMTACGETALYFAAYVGSLSLVMLLLNSGAQPTTCLLAEESELLAAVRSDQTTIAKVLISAGSNVNVSCDDWTPLLAACFYKSAHMIRALVASGADVNLVGEWMYAPINMLFVEHSHRVQLISDCLDEWHIKRCLDSLLTSSQVDVNYWASCALGNPQVITRALRLLSPTLCRMLLNHGACADILFDYKNRAIHDELVVAYSIYGSKLGFGLIDRVNRYTDCLSLLLSHGIEPRIADWVTTARLLLRQLQLVPLSIKYPELEPTFRMLLGICKPKHAPIELKRQCRRVVRRSIGHPLSYRLQTLTFVPPRLKSYIRMEDIGGHELYS